MKRCRACKKLTVREFNGIACSKYCASCRKEKEAEKKIKKQSTKKFQEKVGKKLKKVAWGLVSEYVRRSKASPSGLVKCFTCSVILHWKDLHCGHFRHNRLDFDWERNLRPQCCGCNTYNHGNLGIYALELARELGIEGVEQLIRDANIKGNLYTNDELEAIIADLEQKLKNLNTSN